MTEAIEKLNAEIERLESKAQELRWKVRDLEDADKGYYLVTMYDREDYEADSIVFRSGFCTKTEAENRAKEKYGKWCDVFEIREITQEQNSLYYDGQKFAKAIDIIDDIEMIYHSRNDWEKRDEYSKIKSHLRDEKHLIERKLNVYNIEPEREEDC